MCDHCAGSEIYLSLEHRLGFVDHMKHPPSQASFSQLLPFIRCLTQTS